MLATIVNQGQPCWMVAAAVALLFVQPAIGDVTVTQWRLTCVVVPNAGNPRGVRFDDVNSPFQATHQVTWQGATNTASYDITFDSQQLDFRADTSVTAPGITGGGIFTSACNGNLQFTTTADVLFSVDSHMQYHLPPGDRAAHYSVNLGRIAGQGYLEDGYSSSPVFGDPPAGEYSIQADNILLPGGGSYTMNYGFELDSYSGSPTLLSTIGGHVAFTLRPVPEPATALLLLAGIAAVARRRRAQASGCACLRSGGTGNPLNDLARFSIDSARHSRLQWQIG